MRTIQRMIEVTGGLDKLEREPLVVDHKPYQRLIIHHAGIGPRQLPIIRVTQLFEKRGMTCLDSEMNFELRILSEKSWIWLPVNFRQMDIPLFIKCAWVEHEGHSVFDNEAAWGLTLIAEAWEDILVARGYPGASGIA